MFAIDAREHKSKKNKTATSINILARYAGRIIITEKYLRLPVG